MTRDEKIREVMVIEQQACSHDPKPVPGMYFIKRCKTCGKIFGKNESDMIEAKRKQEKL